MLTLWTSAALLAQMSTTLAGQRERLGCSRTCARSVNVYPMPLLDYQSCYSFDGANNVLDMEQLLKMKASSSCWF